MTRLHSSHTFLLSCLLLTGLGLANCSSPKGRAAGTIPGSGGSDDEEEHGSDDPLGGQGGDGGAGGAEASGADDCETLSCPGNSTCEVTAGGAHCDCLPGFEGPDCLDVNECLGTDVCEGMRCVNTFGSFECRCFEGQIAQGDECVDISECMWGPCDDDATCTDEEDGSYSCSCKAGTFGNGFNCADTDACAGDPCGPDATCITTSDGFACQCPAGKGGATCADSCDVLLFADSALEAAIRVETGKMAGDITQEDIAGITALNLVGIEVKDLTGLECWGHLEVLDLFGSSLGQEPGLHPNALDALGSLNRLRELYLGCTEVTSIDVLEGHPTIERLGLNRSEGCGGAITDWSALPSLTALRWLDVEGGTPLDLGHLEGLAALEHLTLSRAGVDNVSSLSALSSLKSLNLRHNDLTSLSALVGLPLLTTLDASNNQLDSVDDVKGLRYLQRLDVHENQIGQIPDLTNLELLRFLDLSDNSISDVRPLANLGSMEWVGIAGNDIDTLEPLLGSTFMGPLFATDLPLDCHAEAETLLTLVNEGVLPITGCALE